MRWERERWAIELTDEAGYTFGSRDNARSYERELRLDDNFQPSSMLGVESFLDGRLRASAVLGASGGTTGVNTHSCLLLEDHCLVAIGDQLAALALPDLRLLWQVKADDATCFGVHLAPDGRHVVVHGELEISKHTLDGRRVWAFSGRDIFTGELEVREHTLVVADFNLEVYRIDLETGRGELVV